MSASLGSSPPRSWLNFSPTAGVVGLILAGSLFRLVSAGLVGLGYGEAFYFSGAIRPDLSYFDHPPLTFWLGWLALKLSPGVSGLALRLPFILLFAATTWLMYLIGRRLYGPWPGFYAALLLNLAPVFGLATAVFFQPDGLLMFFWLGCVWLLLRLFFEPERSDSLAWWAALGMVLGLGLLSKYAAVFIPFGAVLFALTRPELRRLFGRPGPYLAAGLALVMFTPVFIWNAQHDWISLLWQGGRGLENNGLRLDWLGRNVLGQALTILPWIWVPLAWVLYRGLRGGPQAKEDWFVVSLAVGPIFIFTAVATYSNIGYHFHWQAPGYLMLFLILGQRLDLALKLKRRYARLWLKATLAVTVAALLLAVSHAATGWARDLILRLAPPQARETADPTLEMLDWSALVPALKERGLLDKPDLFLFGNTWFYAGKIDYALQGRMPVLCFNYDDPRSWAFYDRPENHIGQDGLLVVTAPMVYQPLVDYNIYFRRITPLESLKIGRHGKEEKTLHLFYCQELLKRFPLPY